MSESNNTAEESCYFCKLPFLDGETRKPIMIRDGSGQMGDIHGHFHSDGLACNVRLREAYESLAKRIAELQAENMCDACGGTGKPVSGLECMCRGTGKMSEAARYLRERIAHEPNTRLIKAAKALADAMPSGQGLRSFHAGSQVVDLRDAIEAAQLAPETSSRKAGCIAPRACMCDECAPKRPAETRERCKTCDDTGDVHRLDGQWLGYCSCPIGEALKALKHEQRIVGHASGRKEYLPECVCGKPWPCASLEMGES